MNEPQIAREVKLDDQEKMRAHAWQYFTIHAGQRISMFNHFLVLTGLVAAGLAACVQGQGVLRPLGAVMGIFLAIVAFVFWKLDGRTRFLVQHAEDAMMKLESHFAVPEARLFMREEAKTDIASAKPAPVAMWSYTRSFRTLFVITGLAGVGGAAVCLALQLGYVGSASAAVPAPSASPIGSSRP